MTARKPGVIRASSGMTIRERLDLYSIPEPNSGCLLWLGGVDSSNYPNINIPNPPGSDKRYSARSAHKEAWRDANGEVPSKKKVCHKCDNTFCIELNHLFVGSHGDNMRDASAKGRLNTPRGTGKRILTPEQRQDILTCKTMSRRALARKHGVERTAIYRVLQKGA